MSLSIPTTTDGLRPTCQWLAILAGFVGCLAIASGKAFTESPTVDTLVSETVRYATIDSEQPHSFAVKDYEKIDVDLPIGVFDSGIGGLTVLEAVLGLDSFNNETLEPKPDGKPDFESERFIYLGDQANMPYGNYPSLGKENYLRELILRDTIFLLGRRYWSSPASVRPNHDKLPVKAVVIACNTATAYGLTDIRNALKAWGIEIPVIGVVEAGARGVSETMVGSNDIRSVGILATVGTCSSRAYPKAIASATGLAGKRVPAIVQQGCVKLAGAIEGEPTEIVPSIRSDVRALVESHRQANSAGPLDTIVLGCTHFPLVQNQIRDELKRLRELEENGSRPFESLIAEKIALVNPAELTAKELFRELARNRLRRSTNERKNGHRFFLSIPAPTLEADKRDADGGLSYDYKYGRNTGNFTTEDTRYVPMTTELLPTSSLGLIRDRLPHVWQSLSAAD